MPDLLFLRAPDRCRPLWPGYLLRQYLLHRLSTPPAYAAANAGQTLLPRKTLMMENRLPVGKIRRSVEFI